MLFEIAQSDDFRFSCATLKLLITAVYLIDNVKRETRLNETRLLMSFLVN